MRLVLWRAVTGADFFSIERSRAAGPRGGGGQSYVSISFRGLAPEELAEFLAVTPRSRIATDRPKIALPAVGVARDPGVNAPLEFAPRYQLPQPDDRYRISRQNRQFQSRHPAWTDAYDFPTAPDDVARNDPRLPDLTYLKLYVARLDDGTYLAGFFNSDKPPATLAHLPALSPLFLPYDEDQSAGLIRLDAGQLPLQALAAASTEAVAPGAITDVPPEIADTVEETRKAAGKRTTGQGRRQSSAERRAIELHAVARATAELERDGWGVEDVSLYRPYDLHCTRRGTVRRVEVKGTTGDGSAVLLTPGEVRHAREHHPDVCLMIVSGVQLGVDPTSGEVVASGGRLEVVDPWEIDVDGDLLPTGYEYRRRP